MAEKIMLIDGHSILNRAFYGLPDLTNAEGKHTNAVLGFLNIMLRYVEEEKPTYLLVAFDRKEPTFRHLKYKEYKGTRKPMPDELREQVPLMKEILSAMEIPVITQAGIEADDILGTIAREAEEEGFLVAIVSGDRDLLQLATKKIKIKIPKTKSTGTVTEDYFEDDVRELYGVSPVEFIDMKGLMGDPSDNIPGVPGIGEKTAGKIIKEFHSIENAFAHIEEVKPARAKNNLMKYYEQALLSKDLATIKKDCSLTCDFKEAKIGQLFTKEAYRLFKELELKSLFKYFDEEEKEEDILDVTVTSDLSETEAAFSGIIKEKKAGLEIIGTAENLKGISLTGEKGTVLLLIGGFITKDYLRDKIMEMLQKGVTCYVLDYKALLHFEERTRVFESQIEDTGLMAYLLNPLQSSYDYDDLSRDYLHKMLLSRKEICGKKTLEDIFDPQDEKTVRMAAWLSFVPFSVFPILSEKLKEQEMEELYLSIERPTVATLFDMEKHGITVKKEALKVYGDQLTDKITDLEKKIYEQAGKEFNINSPKQLGIILFEDLKLPFAKKTKTGYSTSAEVLEKLAPDYPIVSDILEYRQLTKLKSTYADGLAAFIREDGKIHSVFHQKVTATGRLSSSDPNLQNIPIRMPLGREIRKVFVPEPGYIFVSADYSQIELRVLAHMAGDAHLIAAYQQEEDIHRMTASQVFGVPFDEVTPLQRRSAKAVNFGIVYGISAFGLSQDLNIPRKEAADYIDRYFRTYPGIKTYLDENVAFAKKHGYVKTMYGRIRPIPELSSSNFMQRSFGERAAMNSSIQGTAADIIKIAMVRVSERLKKEQLSSRLILQIHDELLIETKEEEIEKIYQILNEEMTGAADLKVPLSIDIEKGKTWYEAK
ncbi:MAG: DNA polymerase I [Lachnospiraceae bacterium]|nr:DNA polymerase I [Lachnospiraceae bacterium]MDY5497754.1 DNA polymerase I [Anaerobutyricum sp.]